MVALFVQQCGNETAQRYLDHLSVDSWDMAKKCAAAYQKLGHMEIRQRDLKRLEEKVASLRARYGKDFLNEYGWAGEALNTPSPNFSQIEKAVEFDKLRPYYKLASTTVHAGPKGAFWKAGLVEGVYQGLLAGPSNAGLAEAGRLTGMSLAHASLPLMMVHTTIDSVVWMRILLKLSQEVEDEFVWQERNMVADARDAHVKARYGAIAPGLTEKLSGRLQRRLRQ